MEADALRQRRIELGMTQAELGRLLGVPQNTVSRWEMGAPMQHPKMLDLALEAIEKRAAWIDLTDAMHKTKQHGD